MIKIISLKRYKGMLADLRYWRKRARPVVNIPFLDIEGVGNVQVVCENTEQLDRVIERLKSNPHKKD